MIRYFFALFFVLCSLSSVQAATRWVCTPSLCVNNGNGNSNSCAASPGGTGCFDGITNLNLSGLGGGDIVNLYNGVNCNVGNDGFSGTVNIATGGTAGNNLVIQSDPATCGTPTFGTTPTAYQFTGTNIKFNVNISGSDYVTLRNFKITPAAGSGPSEAVIILRGNASGNIVEHIMLDRSALTGEFAGIWWNQGPGSQGTGANNAVIIRYNELVGRNSAEDSIGIRHVTGTGTVHDLQIYGNSVHDWASDCIFLQPRGTGQTLLANLHHNSLVNCGNRNIAGPADWLIYGNGARIHQNHNFADCTDATGATCAGGYRTRGGGSLVEWNVAFRMGIETATGAAGRGMSSFGSCAVQCGEATTFRHNIVTAHSNAHTNAFCFNFAGDSANTINFYNNTCYGFGEALVTNNTSSTRTYRARNNLFLGTNGTNRRGCMSEQNTFAGTMIIENNLFDWGASPNACYRVNNSTNHTTIAAACAALGRFSCTNKGGTGVDETKIVHNPGRTLASDWEPIFPNSGAFGFATMTDGETNHREGFAADIADAHPSAWGRPVIGAVTGGGFPCVGAWELERERIAGNNGLTSSVPTYRCGGILR